MNQATAYRKSTMRRWYAICLVFSLCVVPLFVGAQQPGPSTPPRDVRDQETDSSGQRLVTAETHQAVDRGLAWLAEQQREDGSFWSRSRYRREVAITALAGMAFLSDGHHPNKGKYGAHVTRAVEFLLSRAQQNGLIHDQESGANGPMYGHGFATLFLAEVHGTAPDHVFGENAESDLRRTLRNAVKLIIVSQNSEGGWRYYPDSKDADISVTVCQVMALRAARNAGLAVPTETLDRAIAYVKKCQNSDGGFMYMLNPRGPSLFPRTAAGIVALQSAGIYEGQELEKGVAYLMRHLPRQHAIPYQNNYFYGHYYAIQAMWQVGGAHWTRWYPAIRDELLDQQRANGSWSDLSVCDEYGTAMALIILQLPNNYLPIFQR